MTDRQNLLDKLSTQTQSTHNTFRDNAPSLPQSVATTHPSSDQSTISSSNVRFT